MPKGLRLCTRHSSQTRLFRLRAYAGITLPNQASVFLHESMDFETVGTFHEAGYKFGAWHDVTWLQRGLATESATPAEIASVDSVCRDARWHDC